MKLFLVRTAAILLCVLWAGCGGKSGSDASSSKAGKEEAPSPASPEALREALKAGDAAKALACIQGGTSVTEGWQGEQPIHWAARTGKKELVEAILAKGVDPKVLTQRGDTALHFASTPEVAELFLSRGLDVNHEGFRRETPLFTAADQGHAEVVNFLLTRGADPKAQAQDGGVVPLNVAATRAIAERLVAAGVSPWGETNKWGRVTPPLWTAAIKGRADVAAFLLEKGIPPPPKRGVDDYMQTALWNAVQHRHGEVVAMILEKGQDRLDPRKLEEYMAQAAGKADTNTVQVFLSKGPRSADGYVKALTSAAAKGDIGLLTKILDAGGKADGASSTGYTPLHAACSAQMGAMDRHLSCVDLLLARGANAGAATQGNRQTPLHLAAAADFVSGIGRLIERGADVNAPDEVAATPLHWAVINDARAAAMLLLSKGANPNLALNERASVLTRRPNEMPNPFGGQSVGKQMPLTLAKSDAMKELLRKHGATDTAAPAAPVEPAKPASKPPRAKPAKPAKPAVSPKPPPVPAPAAPPPAAEPAAAPEKKVKKGDTESDVVAIMGYPKGRIKVGKEMTLRYDGGEITMVEGKVESVSGEPRPR